MDPKEGEAIIKKKLTENVPYNAKVTFPVGGVHSGSGWCMKVLSPHLEKSIKDAGAAFYDDKPTGSYG